MEGETIQLPWEALKHTEGAIPWSALYKFAAAVVTDNSLINDLVELYEQAWESGYDHEHYEEYYVPAIFALAAPQLSDERRREIGAFLVEKLAEAGYDDADISMEVLTAACGSMGTVILPLVLETIAKEPDHEGAWFHLWGLTELAGETEDAELRGPVIRACMELLQQADQGEIDPIDAIDAAWTLAILKHTDCKRLLRSLKKKAVKSLCQGDYADALDLLDGCLDFTPPTKLWEMPVKEWLGPRWQMAKKWYSKKDYESGDDETDAGMQRAEELAGLFLESSEAIKLTESLLEDAGFIVCQVLKYAWDYVGSSPEELDERVLSEVLLELLPRKLTAERDFFEKVAPVTEAFLKWMDSEGILAVTADLVQTVHDWADTIVANSMDPEYWGMAKRFTMQAKADGVDVGNQAALQKYIAEYNRRLYKMNLSDQLEARDFKPPIPIVERSPKIGRNDPCPCGSGKKYKKCCGSVRNTNVHD
jgi:hypothetical protein